MSEYVKAFGNEVKIGTCEDLCYVNYKTLAQLVTEGSVSKLDGNCPPKEYLTCGEFRFRFPWPDEDGWLFYTGYDHDHDRELIIDVDQAILGDCTCDRQHEQIAIKMQKPVSGQLWTVIELPCGHLCRIDASDAFKIAAYVLDRTCDKFTRKVMFRIMAGYVDKLVF